MSAEEAFAFNPDEALALGVAFTEIESGGKAQFNFDEMQWRDE